MHTLGHKQEVTCEMVLSIFQAHPLWVTPFCLFSSHDVICPVNKGLNSCQSGIGTVGDLLLVQIFCQAESPYVNNDRT